MKDFEGQSAVDSMRVSELGVDTGVRRIDFFEHKRSSSKEELGW
jgi:hypothetical protein